MNTPEQTTEQAVTKSGKTRSQVLAEARKFCQMNESTKTLERIEWLMRLEESERHKWLSNNKEESSPGFVSKHLMEEEFKLAGLSDLDIRSVEGEKRLPLYVIEELQECVHAVVRYRKEVTSTSMYERFKMLPSWAKENMLLHTNNEEVKAMLLSGVEVKPRF